jgi:hypothetical protein
LVHAILGNLLRNRLVVSILNVGLTLGFIDCMCLTSEQALAIERVFELCVETLLGYRQESNENRRDELVDATLCCVFTPEEIDLTKSIFCKYQRKMHCTAKLNCVFSHHPCTLLFNIKGSLCSETEKKKLLFDVEIPVDHKETLKPGSSNSPDRSVWSREDYQLWVLKYAGANLPEHAVYRSFLQFLKSYVMKHPATPKIEKISLEKSKLFDMLESYECSRQQAKKQHVSQNFC